MNNKTYYIRTFKRRQYKYILFIETISFSTGFYLKVNKSCKHFYLYCFLGNTQEQKIDIKNYKNVINALKENQPINVVGITIKQINKVK